MVSSRLAAILVVAISAQDLFLQPSNATLGAAATGKAGIAQHLQMGAVDTHAVAGSRMSWNYNWDMHGAYESGLDFFPQIHNRASMQYLYELPPSQVVLTFNEPNMSPDYMSPGEAAGYWPQIEDTARRLGMSTIVGPGVANVNPDGWYDEFFNYCSNCKVDAIAIHAYSCDLGNLQNLVNKMKKYNRPLWLTEFACADNPEAIPGNYEKSKAWNWQCKYMQSIIPYLQSEPSVVRYSWFSFDQGYTGQSSLVSGGALTDLGRCYNDLIW